MDQDATWYGSKPRPDDIVLDEDPSHSKGGGTPSPIFGPCLLWRNAWVDEYDTWHGGGPWSRPHCAIGLWGPSSPLQKGVRAPPPQFSAHFDCGQTAGCIKMPLGMEIGLSSGDFVLDGGSDPFPKGAKPPNFRPTSIVAKRLHRSRCHFVRRWASAYATLC